MFSWLGEKVTKKNDGGNVYGHNANDSGSHLWDDVTARQDISTPFSIVIEFKVTGYSYSVRYSIHIRNLDDIRFK